MTTPPKARAVNRKLLGVQSYRSWVQVCLKYPPRPYSDMNIGMISQMYHHVTPYGDGMPFVDAWKYEEWGMSPLRYRLLREALAAFSEQEQFDAGVIESIPQPDIWGCRVTDASVQFFSDWLAAGEDAGRIVRHLVRGDIELHPGAPRDLIPTEFLEDPDLIIARATPEKARLGNEKYPLLPPAV